MGAASAPCRQGIRHAKKCIVLFRQIGANEKRGPMAALKLNALHSK